MDNKNNNTWEILYFYTSMPKIHLEYKEERFWYEQAFHNREENNDCEYCLNTTTWD